MDSNWSAQGSLRAALVLVVAGGVAAVAMQQFKDDSPAESIALHHAAETAIQDWEILTGNCGVDTAFERNPLPKPGDSALDILAGGADHLNAAYRACYQRTLNPLLASSYQSAAPHDWRLGGYPVTLSGGGGQPYAVTLDRVPSSLAASFAQRFAAKPTARLAETDEADPRVRYRREADGHYRVDLLFPASPPRSAARVD